MDKGFNQFGLGDNLPEKPTKLIKLDITDIFTSDEIDVIRSCLDLANNVGLDWTEEQEHVYDKLCEIFGA